MVQERLYADRWGVLASTTDVRYVLDVSSRVAIWPFIRGHIQTSANFYELAYTGAVSGDAIDVPKLRTGDRELSPLGSATFGGGLRWDVGSGSRHTAWSISAQGEATRTEYFDTLFITNRLANLAVLQLSKRFE